VTWKINWSDEARKQLRKLDKQLQNDIIEYLGKQIANANHPHDFGKSLRHDKHGLWRYRVRDARIICNVYENELSVLVVRVGHRKNIYNF